jgi:ATP-dependent RNA helicase DHX37/DHR1
VIIDEAHERKINSDLLLGLLSRVVNIRAKLALQERLANPEGKEFKIHPLRLVIMSATLKVDDFTENKYLFPQKLNVINVESRQFPVKEYFAKKTEENYFNNCLKRVKQIHEKLPSGGVLVFLTGEEEIKYFCKMLEIELQKSARIMTKRKKIQDREECDFEEKDYDVESDVEEDVAPKGKRNDDSDSEEEAELAAADRLEKDMLSTKLKIDRKLMKTLKETKGESADALAKNFGKEKKNVP